MAILGTAQGQDLHMACGMEAVLDCRSSCLSRPTPSCNLLPYVWPGDGEHWPRAYPLRFHYGGLVRSTTPGSTTRGDAEPKWVCVPGLVEAREQMGDQGATKGFQYSSHAGLGDLKTPQLVHFLWHPSTTIVAAPEHYGWSAAVDVG